MEESNTYEVDKIWSEYKLLESNLERSEMLSKLNQFINIMLMQSSEYQTKWISEYCRQQEQKDSPDTRMPLFEKLIFPVLSTGYKKNKPNYTRWLSMFHQLLYQKKSFSQSLSPNKISEYNLLRDAIKNDPLDRIASIRLIAVIQSRIDYDLHEIPLTVLGFENNKLKQSLEVSLNDINLAEDLMNKTGIQSISKQKIKYAREHYEGYYDYIKNLDQYINYEAYCKKHNLEIDY